MTDYHVKVSGDDGTGDGSEGNPYRQIAAGMDACTAGGSAAFGSSPDRVLVHYDAVGTFDVVPAELKRGIPVVGVDSTGAEWDTSDLPTLIGLLMRNERPVITAAAGNLVAFYEWQSWHGFVLDGQGTASAGMVAASGRQETWCSDVLVRGVTGKGFNGGETGSIYTRIWAEDCDGDGFDISGFAGAIEINGFVALRCGARGIGAVEGDLQHGVVVGCGHISGGGGAVGVVDAASELRNWIAYDNQNAWGFRSGPTLTNCDSFSSDGGTYHTTDNFEGGGVPATCLSVAPEFVDVGNDDLRLAGTSPLIAAGAAQFVASEGDFGADFDGVEWDSPPSVGAYQYVEVVVTYLDTDPLGFGSPSVSEEGPFDRGFGSPTAWPPDATSASGPDATPDLGFGSPTRTLVFGLTVIGTPPLKLPDEGGVVVDLVGDFPERGPYRVRLVDSGAGEHPGVGGAYSGVPGQGAELFANAGLTRVRFILPPLNPGTYDIKIGWGPGYGEEEVLADIVDVVRRTRCAETYRLRRRLQPLYESRGPTSMSREPALGDVDIEFPRPHLEVALHALGQELQFLFGVPSTRLTASLSADGTTATVESTLAAPSAGAFWADGLRFTYSAKTDTTLTGVACEVHRTRALPDGTELVFDVARS